MPGLFETLTLGRWGTANTLKQPYTGSIGSKGAYPLGRDVVGSIMTGAPTTTPAAVSTPLGNTGAAPAQGKQSLWSKLKEPNPVLGYTLGRTAQAIAGRWQDAPFAQVGALGAELAQKQAMQTTLKRVLAGESIGSVKEARILTGDQYMTVLGEKTRLQDASIRQAQETLKLFKDVATLNVDIETKSALYKNIVAQTGLTEAQAAEATARAEGTLTREDILSEKDLDRKQDVILQELHNLGAEKVANINAATDIQRITAEFGDDPYVVKAAQYATAMAGSDMRTQMAGLSGLSEDEQGPVWEEYTTVWKNYFNEMYKSMTTPGYTEPTASGGKDYFEGVDEVTPPAATGTNRLGAATGYLSGFGKTPAAKRIGGQLSTVKDIFTSPKPGAGPLLKNVYGAAIRGRR